MEAGSKDRPPMLAPSNYVQLKSRTKRYIDTNPNHELIDYCLTNPPYKLGSPITRTERFQETYKNVSQEIHDQLNSKVEPVQIILTGIDNDIYSTVDACPNACEMWKAIERIGNVAGARETVGSTAVQKSRIKCYNCREFGHVARECQKPKWVKDAAYHKEKMLLYQELKAHYMYMAKLQEVSLDAADSGPIFDDEPLQKVSNDDHYNVFAMESEHLEQSESVLDTYPIEQDAQNVIIDSLDMSNDRVEINQNDDNNDLATELELLASFIEKLKCEIDESKNRNKFLETSNKKEAQIKLYKTREDKELDKVIALENKVKVLDNNVYKTGQSVQTMNMLNNKCQTSFAKPKFLKKAQRVNPRLYDIGCYNDNLALMLAPESDEVIRLEKQSRSKLSDLIRPFDYNKLNNLYDLFVPQREKLSEQRYFSERSRMSHTSVNNGNSKASFNKQTTVLGKRMDESISLDKKVIPTTSVSRPQLKSNLMGDIVMHNNSQRKKKEVEDQRRNVKLSKNKTSVTTCNDSLNAKTLNVNFVCATCDTCMLNDKHDMCVLNSVAKPIKKTVFLESNQKPRNISRKLYERVSKTCSWWYPKFTPSGYKWKPKSGKENLIEIVIFIFDSGYSKHMIGNLKLLINFVEKFMGTVKFRNDQIAPILGYGDLVQGSITIKGVYYVKGLNHKLFSVGQFCDADLKVTFRKATCYIRDLKANDLLTGSRGTDLYSIALQDINCPNPICLMAKATSSQAWLFYRRLSYLNFDTINLLSKNDIVVGLPKLKFVKDHLCSSCELGKAKRKYFHTKITPSSKRRLQLLHMDLCGPMRVATINGKRYVLVIVDDYSRYTWTHFLRSKDETPEVLIKFLRLVQRGLQAQVRIVRTDKGMEFLNQTLHAYFAVTPPNWVAVEYWVWGVLLHRSITQDIY
nr:hypothetical protein [Tanacetum cinerariifolium]